MDGHERVGGITGGGWLWDRLVNACAETTTDGNVAGSVAGLSSLVPQLLFPSPFGPSVGKPHLEIQRLRDVSDLTRTRGTGPPPRSSRPWLAVEQSSR